MIHAMFIILHCVDLFLFPRKIVTCDSEKRKEHQEHDDITAPKIRDAQELRRT